MVKEGLEGALMEAVDTETAVCSLSYVSRIEQGCLIVHCLDLDLFQVDYLIIAEELQLVDLKAVALK